MRTLFKSKIHRGRITQTVLAYEGSITLDRDLMDAADLVPYEKVQVLIMETGARFETYVIPGERGDRQMCLNGPAARLAHTGDTVLVVSYVGVPEERVKDHVAVVVHVDETNAITGTTRLEQ